MSFSSASLESLKSHWALSTVGAENLARSEELVNQRLAQRAVGHQISFNFAEDAEDDELLEKTALAYELAAIEGLDELSRPAGGDDALREQAAAAAFRAFEIRRLLNVPEDISGRMFFVLHLSALAYCGDRGPDIRRWYKESADALIVPGVDDVEWDRRLLYRLFECWVSLFRKDGWNDLSRISGIVAGLRDDQEFHETQRLQNESQPDARAVALRLVALYHWAKATEVIALYVLQGGSSNPFGQIDQHFEAGVKAASASGDVQHELILRWLHTAGRIMVTNSLWWATRAVNPKTSEFVRTLTSRESRSMFELLPPQSAALLEQGLLDQAKTAIVVDLPTSGGKTLLAQFRILQALNQFADGKGWVAYVAPTRALCAQLTRRLRQDFEPIAVNVEQLTAAVDVDAFEEELLTNPEQTFDVLVATPEKLSLIIRNKKIERPMALIVMDEAHNLETESRGLRIELLLATVKRDCPRANFLLLMPYAGGAESIARWLAQDINAGQSISLGTMPWKPNERIIGLYRAVEDNSVQAGWHLEYETLATTEKAMHLHGSHRAGGVKPINVPKSKVLISGKQSGLGLQSAAIGCVMAAKGTSIAVANNIPTVWTMARNAMASFSAFEEPVPRIRLVQDFLRTEVSPEFELVDMLECGVGVHHAGLSEETRALMEWLAERGDLRILCATSTIAQGLNFPVSSVFLASRFVFQGGKSVEISPREFWNLVGRAGRIDHDSVGVVGIAEGTNREANIEFVGRNIGTLVSRLVTLLDQLVEQGNLANLSQVLWQDQWEDFRCYIAHLWAEKKNLDAVLADSEQLMRQTFGYTTLRNDPAQQYKAEALLSATQSYAREIGKMRSDVPALADATGFSPEGVSRVLSEFDRLESKLTPSDWAPESLFGSGSKMADLFGIMLNVPQLREELERVGGSGFDKSRLSNLTNDWVNGKRLDDIAKEYFNDDSDTTALTNACRAIYRAIVNSGTWGISALSHMSGIDFESLSERERRRINALPAMIYHGVRSEDAVLMRMNGAPRSAAESLGELYRSFAGEDETRYSVGKARNFLKELSVNDWTQARPNGATLSGEGYKNVWEILSGEGVS